MESEKFELILKEIEFIYSRSSGPGGQKVNKTSTKAELRWDVEASTLISEAIKKKLLRQNPNRFSQKGILYIKSDKYRDKDGNSRECVKKLKSILEKAYKIEKLRRPTVPTKSSVEKRLLGKRKHSEKKLNRKSKLVDD
ncbi:MAG: alternative ribosome rescue aminoacyl-tRNA hydrolase ArfB [Bdellovibrionota bacterium]